MAPALTKADQGFRESAGDPVWSWKFRVLKAEILQGQTRNTEVLNLLAVPPPPQLGHGEFAVRAKAAEGLAHVRLNPDADDQGRFKEAEETAAAQAPEWQCEVRLFEGLQARSRARNAERNSALKNVQLGLAEQRFLESLRLAREYKQSFIEWGALNNLGNLLTTAGRFDEAIDWRLQSLDFARRHHNRLTENFSIANLAWSYAQLGDLEKAISNFNEVVKVVDSLDQDQLKLDVFNNMGETYFAQGNYSAAREAYLKAFAIASEMESGKRTDERPHMQVALNNLAALSLDENKLEDAENYNRQALALDSKASGSLLTEARIAARRHKLVEAESLLNNVTNTSDTDQFVRWEVERELANIYAEEHQNIRAQREFEKLIDALEAFRSSVFVTENRLAFSFHAGRYYDDYVGFLVATGHDLTAFQVAEFSRARTLLEGVIGLKAPAHPGDISIEKIQAFLKKENKIVLAYWLTADKSFLWLISSSRFKPFVLGSGDEIEKQAGEYNKMLSDPGNTGNVDQRGQALYEALVAPAEKLIPHDANVVIVPDGKLNRINFETLRVSRPKPHYWIEDVEAEVTSSTTLLINSRRSKSGHGLLLIGDPVQASPDYPPLPHAAEELRRVEAHFPPDQRKVISGVNATPSSYQSSHPEKFAFIHFVTHGTASELSPLESAIVLSSQEDGSFKLYARDIVKTRLNADLVTISACYGAGTRAYSGEGLVGLAWAFLHTGAHQVVAGLWEVDDRAAVILLDDFHTGLQKWKSASAALRLAKLKMVKSDSVYNRPYYWASLQLYMGS